MERDSDKVKENYGEGYDSANKESKSKSSIVYLSIGSNMGNREKNLRKAVDMGTGKRVRWLGFKRPCGGKTGTVGWTGKKDTDKTMDAWFIGFTPDLVAGVWIGNDDGSPLGEKITGSVAAIPVWTKFMKESLKGKPVKDFPCPPGIVFKSIDLDTGLVASPTCKNTQWFAFLKKNVPSQISSQSKEKDKFIVKEFNPSRFSSFWL